MKRREFITLVGGAVAWPRVARAQQGVAVVGLLNAASPESAFYMAGLREGLRDAGYVEGQNVTLEFRWAEGHYERLPALAADLVRHPVSVIVAGGIPPLMAAKAATSTIPIVFSSAGDPVRLGVVASLNRPGGNITGISHFGVALAPKRLQLLLELVPAVTVIAVLENPNNPRTELEVAELQEAARTTGKRRLTVRVGSIHNSCTSRSRRATRCGRTAFYPLAQTTGYAGCAPRDSRDIRLSRFHCGRRATELRNRSERDVSASGRSRCSSSQGCEADGAADPPADEIRVGDQPQDRQGPGTRHAFAFSATCRRGNRVDLLHCICLLLALTAVRCGAQNSTIGATTDITGAARSKMTHKRHGWLRIFAAHLVALCPPFRSTPFSCFDDQN